MPNHIIHDIRGGAPVVVTTDELEHLIADEKVTILPTNGRGEILRSLAEYHEGTTHSDPSSATADREANSHG